MSTKTVPKKKRRSSRTRKRSLQAVVSSRLIECVPRSWLDSLLSGPSAVLPTEAAGKWGCPDIERLLNALRERMTKAANEKS